MTTDEYIQSLRAKVAEIESGKALFLASSTATKDMVLRVFTNGLNSENQRITNLVTGKGYDNEREIYLNPKTSVGSFKPEGKPKLKNSTNDLAQKINSSFGLEKRSKRGAKKKLVKDEYGFKGIEDHKTKWFASYKAYRAAIGREVSKVNLKLSGELKSDIESSLTRVSNTEYILKLKRQIDADKIEGQQERYGIIFKFTKEERQKFLDTFSFENKQK